MAENLAFRSPRIPARPLRPAQPHVIRCHPPCPTRLQRSIRHGMEKRRGERSHDNDNLWPNLDRSLDHTHGVKKASCL